MINITNDSDKKIRTDNKRERTITRREILMVSAAMIIAATAFVELYEKPDESDADGGAISWDFDDGVLKYDTSLQPLTVSVVGWMGDPTDVIIPDTVTNPDDGLVYSVTAVGDKAFKDCNFLVSVDFGNSVETIGDEAFENCYALESITIGNVTNIGEYAFAYCTALETMDFGSVETIKTQAFWNCSALTTIDLGSVETIEDYTFADCTALTTIDFGSVGIIKEGVFSNCAALTTIDFGSVGTIEDGAFAGCTSLETIDFGSVETIGHMAFYGCTALITIDLNGVEIIGDTAFAYCASLTTIDFGNVTTVRDWAFAYCDVLESVTIDGGAAVGAYAFDSCPLLDTVTVTGDDTTDVGVIASYFKKTMDWKLPGMSQAAVCLFLDDLDSAVYDPNGTPGIAGDDGRKLWFGVNNAAYEWDTGSSRWILITYTMEYSISGTVTFSDGTPAGGVRVSLGQYETDTDASGDYTILNIPFAASGDVIASLDGYTQTSYPRISHISGDMDDIDMELALNEYTVTMTAGTGISGFTYEINGSGTTVDYSGPFTVTHGDSLVLTAVTSAGYAFDKWSSSSTSNPLTISYVTGNTNLTATASTSGAASDFTVTFDSGPEYTVYVGSSPLHSAVTVTGGDDLAFSIRVSEGYTARPSLSGMAGIYLQTNGWYVLHDISSDVHVNISVQSDGNGSGGGSGTGGGSGSGSNGGGYGTDTGGGQGGYDSGGGSGGGSDTGEIRLPYWVPVLIIAAILGCMFLLFIIFRRRKDEEEE